MKLVYFVRHGQSEANVGAVFQGAESPLTATGRKQASRIAARVARLPVEVVIVSPLKRAQETAECIKAHTTAPIITSPLFQERKKPRGLEGKSLHDPKAQHVYHAWVRTLFARNRELHSGENYERLVKRAQQALRFLEKRSEQHIAVVTHGFFMRILAAIVIHGKANPDIVRVFAKGLEMENTGLTVFRFTPERGWQLWIWNDHSHLG